MTKIFSSVEYAHILSLPKDKAALDFIKQKLFLSNSAEQMEVIEELFEMHRTSTGFDPLSLSKGRFKRIKVAEFRQILSYIDHELTVIIQSAEYKEFLQKQNRSSVIYEKLKLIKNKIEKVDFVNLEKEVQEFKEVVVVTESRDLFIAFAILFNPLHKEKRDGRMDNRP